ncbi:bifunctional (p)ppGpp synthetase/guanosine-3',5'-bis(diphosphate) 3'-pyrophosphohydrolase [Rhodoferax sp.]|uniref:RelA/SpoT family protein n=1 Tax=Rhodoferax sp. TaxID=50421 RepID=UPI0025D53AF8|nr:bifunctional (p)ppGpp synthetase/guanosine-3',5'-bis(diphosphate) 3'-pyrophosphohydrolase [Rhodoferax sp.]
MSAATNQSPSDANHGALVPKGLSAAESNAAAASFASLTSKLDYLSASDLASVRSAYRFSDEAHLGQIRNSGEPYITHPIAVAAQCAEWKLDAQALMAALLHDAMEDCEVTKPELIERFGSPVAELVDGLTKLEKLQFNTREENQAESFRKMLLAMARDVRVILIKLADRTHNMRTLSDAPRAKWGRIASETLDVYAPIAHRLGLNQTYRELQDLSFRYLRPWRYAILSKAVAKARGRRRDLIQKVQTDLESMFEQYGMHVRISGREKTLYSIHHKMVDKNLSFAEVTDIYGFRVIVPSLIDCYTALGLLHQLYKPVPGKFKDHIAISKINGYQSLHTTLVGPSGINVEFQVRTEAMHLVAETGVAAHWLYKEYPHEPSVNPDRLGSKWLQSLLDIGNETHDATEFWEHVKVDLFPDAVYVFTPKSRIMAMPRGATVVDFAYAIHSSVGDHAVAAKVNGEQVPLRTEVQNGDVIEVVTDKGSFPNPAWLGFVRTARARSKIRQHLRSLAQEDSQNLGEKMLVQALRAEGIDRLPEEQGPMAGVWDKLLRFSGNRNRSDLLVEIGLGRRIASIVAKRLARLLADVGEKPDALLLTRERFMAGDSVAQGSVAIDGSENTSVRFAACCRPIPGDAIVGYLGRGEGLTIHDSDCPVAVKLKNKDSERFIVVEWSDEPVRTFETGIVVTVNNNKGVLAKVAAALAAAEVDITQINMADESAHGPIDLRFIIAVRDVQQLDNALRSLRHTHVVLKAQRVRNGN